MPVIYRAGGWLNEYAIAVAGSMIGAAAALGWLGWVVGFRRVLNGLKTVSRVVFGACLLAMTGALLGLIFRSAIFGP